MKPFEMLFCEKNVMISITTFLLTEAVNIVINLTDSSGLDMQLWCPTNLSYLDYRGLNMWKFNAPM